MMDRQIPEADWKKWRKISEAALERFCGRILGEAAAFERAAGTAHERYLKLHALVSERDDDIAAVFNDQRRSTAYRQIAQAVADGIVTREELASFSEDTQAVVRLLLREW
jgi:hypothetical protein